MKFTHSGNWLSEAPTNCDICKKAIKGFFTDGRTKEGPWAIMCDNCHEIAGCGLGLGKGQRYSSKTLKKIEEVKVK